MSSIDLRLSEPLASEWTLFTAALKEAGISLKAEPDVLLWAGGDGSGKITANNLYLALQKRFFDGHGLPWRHKLWKLQMPLKLKLFAWLAGYDKLLTWAALQRRGWMGPSVCLLCRSGPEDLLHLLLYCPFSKAVWQQASNFFSLQIPWRGSSINDAFTRWFSAISAPHSLVIHFGWQLWLERNRVLFEGAKPSLHRVYFKTLFSFKLKQDTRSFPPPRAMFLDLAEGHTLAFFDGAAQTNGARCGAGGFFKTHQSRTTYWFINCGTGSNTKAKLLGLWTTLSLAASWSLDDLYVQGDSKVIIDWITNKCKLNSIHLEGWMRLARELLQRFTNINFLHVSRTFNRIADALSKRALSEVAGRLSIYHCDSGIESHITSINIFE
jgi:ribonuclease HI